MEQSNDGKKQIAKEFPLFRVYTDGSVEILYPPIEKVPPSEDPSAAVHSKDVTISSSDSDPDSPPVLARLFKPATAAGKLPVLIYFHGGGFCMESAFSTQYHSLCSRLAAQSGALVVSVEYGLFPARPMPGSYDDSWEALLWVAAHAAGAGPEPWLNHHADFTRVFLGGDSAGGNISHVLASRVGSTQFDPPGIKLAGIVLVHPLFGGGAESCEGDRMWLYMFPGSAGPNDPRLVPDPEDLTRLGCDRVLIFVAEEDSLRGVGKKYYEELTRSTWRGRAEIVEDLRVGHVFHILDPTHEKTDGLIKKFASFIREE